MNKLLTKNLAISILIGASIVGGAFWMRFTDSAKSNRAAVLDSTNPVTTADSAKIAEVTPGSTANNNPTIKVADLPNINGQEVAATLSTSNTSKLTPEELATLQFIHTPSGSTLSYDELTDKNTLYTEGALKYAAKDIKTETTNRATLLTYGINLSKIFSGYPFYTKLTPVEITFNIFNNKNTSKADLAADEAGMTELKATGISYEAISKRLLAISVPSGLVDLHVKLANSTDRTAQLIKNMELVGTNKLLALNSARQYVEEAKFLINNLVEVSKYLGDKNIDLGEGNKIRLAVDIIN